MVAIVAAALALRLAVLLVGSYPLESDEAIVGLMARHILSGERPIFYYGQPYMGATEAYLVSAVFWLAGSSTFTLRLAPLALSLAFVYLTFLSGSKVFGRQVGLLSSAYVAVSPPFLTMWSLKARGGYVETLVLGNAILLLALGIAQAKQDSFWRWVALGFLAGLALWVNELVLPYLLAALVTLFLWRRAFVWSRGFLAAAAGAMLGGLPLWVYNWQYPMATFQHLFGANAGSGSTTGTFLRNLLDLARYATPVLLGGLQGTSCLECFQQQRAESRLLYYLALLVAAFLGFLVLWVHRRAAWSLLRLRFDPAGRETPLLVLLVVTPLLFSVSQVGFLHDSEPRYLLPLFSTVPLFVAAAARLLGNRSHWLTILTAAVLIFNLQANWRVVPTLAMPVIEGRQPAQSNRELASFVEARGIQFVYTDYWIAYTLAFESDERIIPSVLGPSLTVGYNRYVPYAYLVSVAKAPAYIFMAGTTSEHAFVKQTQAEGVRYRRETVGHYGVYYDLNPPRYVK